MGQPKRATGDAAHPDIQAHTHAVHQLATIHPLRLHVIHAKEGAP